MDFGTLIEERYSLRYFDTSKAVPMEHIDSILEAARLAPTAHNAQAFHIYQLSGEGLVDVLKPVTNSHFRAPLVLVLTMDESRAWRRRDGFSNAAIDIGIVGTHMQLQAQSLGLGSCWVGSFDPEALRDLLPLSGDEAPVAMLMIGYPSDRAKPGPLHSTRRSLDDLVTEVLFFSGETDMDMDSDPCGAKGGQDQ